MGVREERIRICRTAEDGPAKRNNSHRRDAENAEERLRKAGFILRQTEGLCRNAEIKMETH